MRTFAALACLFLFLAGCLQAPTHSDAQDAPAADRPETPAGCVNRGAIVHGPGAAVQSLAQSGVPCLVSTSWGTSEPSLGVAADGTLFLYPAYEAPNEQLAAAEQFTGMAIARSQDEGATFERRTSFIGPVDFHPYTADPYMYLDPYTGRVFFEDLIVPPFNCANVSYSDDNGETWSQTLGGCGLFDHVGWASGPPAVSDGPYPVVLQRCAISYGLTYSASLGTSCQRSLDGGVTWELPGDPPFLFGPDGPYVPPSCSGAAHHPFIDHRGWTWIARRWCDGAAWVAVSKDEGGTWTQHRIAEDGGIYHDVAIGVDTAGHAFAFWIDSDDRPVLSVSLDEAATWSQPMDIAAPGVEHAGMVSLAPGGVGKAALSYVATLADAPDTHGIVVAAYDLHTTPRFHSAIVSSPEAPLEPRRMLGRHVQRPSGFSGRHHRPRRDAMGQLHQRRPRGGGPVVGRAEPVG